MQVTILTLAALLGVCSATAPANTPVLHVNIRDPSLPNGVGSLGLEGEYQRELTDSVNAGVKYEYNVARGLPSSLWVSTSADIDDETTLTARAEYEVKSKATVIEARLNRGEDEIAMDFDTATNEAGPVRIRKVLDMNGRRLTLKPKFNVQDRTGELVINTEVDEDKTTAELTLNQADESASLEVSHRLDDYNVVSPKVDLKSGDVSVRLNRALDNGGLIEVTADRRNVDWEFAESAWTVSGNIPLEDTAASSISFKRSINLS